MSAGYLQIDDCGGHSLGLEIKKAGSCRAGVISDTHGLLRPEAIEALEGADLIIHAGDIGDPMIVDELGTIAPIAAVRGNMDQEAWARGFPLSDTVDINGMLFYVLHDINRIDLDPASAGMRVVISGHSHEPLVQEEEGVLYINPGSAGPKRFKLPVTMCILDINGMSVETGIIKLSR